MIFLTSVHLKVNNIYYLLCDDLCFLAGLKKPVIDLVGLLEAMLISITTLAQQIMNKIKTHVTQYHLQQR